MSSRARSFGALFALALAAGCDATAPLQPGSIRVTTFTSGLDMAAFVVKVDDATHSIGPTDQFGFDELTAGTHVVTLVQLPANCTVDGDNPRSVEVLPKQVTVVPFNLVCVARTGVVEVTMASAGLDSPLSYGANIDGAPLLNFPAGGVIVLNPVSGGSHTIELRSVGTNCSVVDGAAHTFTVSVGTLTRDTVRVRFDITCIAVTGVVEVAFTATTPDFTDVFRLRLGAANAQVIAANGVTRINGVAAGDHLLTLLLPSTCTAAGGTEQTLTIHTGTQTRDTVRTSFSAQCTRTDKIAFVRGSDVTVVNTDGTNLTLLGFGFNPFWAPDGRQIVFSKTGCDDYYYCYFVGLYRVDRRLGVAPEVRITTNLDDYPSWRPDGTSIAYVRNSGLIFLVTPEGANAGSVPFPDSVFAEARPAWSPDGSRLVFGCGKTASTFRDICTVNVNGSGFAYLTNDAQWNGEPSVSPDGTRIVFARMDFQADRVTPPAPYIAVMNANGTGITRLAPGSQPAWSRDGTKIVFRGGYDLPGIYIMNANGSNVTRLTDKANDRSPIWQP